MPIQGDEDVCIHVGGDWSLTGIAAQVSRLVEQLALLGDTSAGREPVPGAARSRVRVELAGVEAIDACGCQLLAVLLNELRQSGRAPVVSAVPARIGEKIHLLGFGHELVPDEEKG